MVRSPIQSKKQGIKNSSGGEGWRQQEGGVGQNFKKVVWPIQGSFHNIGDVRNPFQL